MVVMVPQQRLPALVYPHLQVIVCKSYEHPADWDKFAILCGASFRASYYASRAWQLDHHILHRLRRFSCFINQGGRSVKIAQAAIGFGRRRRIFAEGLQVLPEFEAMWTHIMSCLLSCLGDAEYQYGSPWSLEKSRLNELSLIDGVEVGSIRTITVHTIHFARWESWEAYFSDLSKNAKRNARRAERVFTELTIKKHRGWSSLIDVYHLMSLRKKLHRRKRLSFPSLVIAFRFLLRISALRDATFTALAYTGKRPVATFGGIVFGQNTYFLESGSVKQNDGALWLLIIRMLRDAYERAPLGHFILGFHRNETIVDPGLARFRAQCQSTTQSVDEVTFNYNLP